MANGGWRMAEVKALPQSLAGRHRDFKTQVAFHSLALSPFAIRHPPLLYPRAADLHDDGVLVVVRLQPLRELLGRGVKRIQSLSHELRRDVGILERPA